MGTFGNDKGVYTTFANTYKLVLHNLTEIANPQEAQGQSHEAPPQRRTFSVSAL